MTVSSIATGYDGISLLAGNAAYDPAAFFLIQRVAGTGSSGTITFSSIPQTYKHLQIRYISKDTSAADGTLNPKINFNGDTGNNYAYHELRGDGTSATTNAGSAYSGVLIMSSSLREASSTATMGVAIVDIHDYASTTNNKTVRYAAGVNKNLGTTADRISLGSGLWVNTAAINSITITANVANFTTSSTFALYGMK